MPIHDQSYRRYGGQRENLERVWFVVARAGMMTFLKKRAFLGLAGCSRGCRSSSERCRRTSRPRSSRSRCWRSRPRPTAGSSSSRTAFVFFVTVYVGAGLIANDRRANALQIYLSKPLTRGEYILGKFAILFGFLLLVTLLPALLLLLLQGAFAGNFAFLRQNLYLVPAITLFSLIQVLVASLSMLALSAMSNSSRFVAIMFAGIVLFSDAMFAALRGILGTSTMSWISVPATLAQIGDFVFRIKLRYDTPIAVSFIVILALVAVSVSVLERKVRGVEVVT